MAHNVKLSEQTMKAFTKIVDFVSQLHEAFCVNEQYHEVELYNHLLGKTKISNKSAINRHVELFTDFVLRNSDAIAQRDYKKIVSNKVSYSEKVYIDIRSILSQTNLDKDTADSIWNHLLVIQAIVDPTSKAKELLKQFQESNVSSSSEGKFLNNFLQKVESSINKDDAAANPMMAASSLLQGGILSDLVGSIDSGVKNGELDLGKLVGTVQQMLGGIGGESNGGDAGLGGIMNMFGGMMNQFSSKSSGGITGTDPDNALKQIEARVETERKQMEETGIAYSYTAVVSETDDSQGK